jgi:hypothetical protein
MARLRELWTAANSGVPALTLICGEAGIGKTRLADELARAVTAAGGTVLAARCYETERSLFLQPIADAIAVAVRSIPAVRMQDLAGQHGSPLARLVPEVAALLGPLTGPAGLPEPGPAAHQEDAELERRRTFAAVTAFVLAAAEHAPVLLSLDDLQNAGRATAELLHYLIRHARRGRLLVVATVRAEEGAGVIDSLAPVSTWIDLGALPGTAVADLAAEAGLADQADAVSQRTRGHTLFVVETLRALAAGTTGIPESLEAAVLVRVRRAGPAVEAALRAASVLGASFEAATLAGLLGESPHAVVGTCTAAENARLLVVTERDYEFANDLVQEVLYATTPGPARVAYHSRAADLLTSRPEAMAGHAAAAGDWARAARGWRLAGEQALARAAVADAAELLTQSVEAADRAGDPEDQARSLLARGRALELQADYADTVRDITAAIAAARGAGDLRMEMTGLIALGGDAPVALGQPIPDAIATLERGLSLASALSDRAAEALLRARLAIYAVNGLRFGDALEQGSLAIRAARASGNEVALAAAFDGYKTAVAYVGDIDALVPVIEELKPMLRRQGDLLRLHWTTFDGARLLASGHRRRHRPAPGPARRGAGHRPRSTGGVRLARLGTPRGWRRTRHHAAGSGRHGRGDRRAGGRPGHSRPGRRRSRPAPLPGPAGRGGRLPRGARPGHRPAGKHHGPARPRLAHRRRLLPGHRPRLAGPRRPGPRPRGTGPAAHRRRPRPLGRPARRCLPDRRPGRPGPGPAKRSRPPAPPRRRTSQPPWPPRHRRPGGQRPGTAVPAPVGAGRLGYFGRA